MRVVEASAFFHQRHYRVDHRGVLLIWGQVHHHVSGGDQLFVSADGKTVLGCIFPTLAFFLDRACAQGIGYVEARVAQVQTLVQALGAAANDNDFLTFQVVAAICKLAAIHKTAFTQLFELQAQRQAVEVVLTHGEAPDMCSCSKGDF